MFLTNLQRVYQRNQGKDPAYIRNILKEYVQYYLLQFIGQSSWADRFIFKGGTCLRFFFDLPRISEDLDFDIMNFKTFDLGVFMEEVKTYFISTVQYKKVELKLAGNKRILYIRFPILRDIGVSVAANESDVVFVRIDVAPVIGTKYSTEISIKSTYDFSLLIKRYTAPDLFSGKIASILTREAIEGTVKKERTKGRDYYDLIWFLEKGIRPNWAYFEEITGLGKREALDKLDTKIKKADISLLQKDLMPFFEDNTFVEAFCKNIGNLYLSYRKILE